MNWTKWTNGKKVFLNMWSTTPNFWEKMCCEQLTISWRKCLWNKCFLCILHTPNDMLVELILGHKYLHFCIASRITAYNQLRFQHFSPSQNIPTMKKKQKESFSQKIIGQSPVHYFVFIYCLQRSIDIYCYVALLQ